jgi:hypothetical protein
VINWPSQSLCTSSIILYRQKKLFICFRFLVAHNTFVFFFFWWQLKEYHFRLALYAENLPLEISKLLECLHSYLIVYTLLHEGKSTMHTVPFCITWCFVRPKMLICFFCMNQLPGANLAEIPFIGTSGMYWCQGMTQHWIGNLFALFFWSFMHCHFTCTYDLVIVCPLLFSPCAISLQFSCIKPYLKTCHVQRAVVG